MGSEQETFYLLSPMLTINIYLIPEIFRIYPYMERERAMMMEEAGQTFGSFYYVYVLLA
jgi:hypothetical protein